MHVVQTNVMQIPGLAGRCMGCGPSLNKDGQVIVEPMRVTRRALTPQRRPGFLAQAGLPGTNGINTDDARGCPQTTIMTYRDWPMTVLNDPKFSGDWIKPTGSPHPLSKTRFWRRTQIWNPTD